MITCFSTYIQTFAYEIYEGSISSTYTTYFNQILTKHSPIEDYIVFRNGQYDYIMLVGDLYLNGSTFTGSDLTEYSIRTDSSNYNSTYKLYTSTGNSLDLNVNNNIIYSNLGSFPNIIERGDIYEFNTLFTFIIIGLCVLVRPMFKFTYRSR